MIVEEQQQITTIDSLSLTNLGTYMLWGEINEETSYYACDFLIKSNLIFGEDENITMFINSCGGLVTEGQAIIDIMETSRVNIATRAIGQIASMGVSIFIAGTPGMRVMTKNCEVMTHQFTSGMYGKAHELVAVRKSHDELEKHFIEHYVRHTKMTEQDVRDILLGPSDRYLTADECLKYGICDAIMDPWELNYVAEPEPVKKKVTKKKVTKKKVSKKKTAAKA